MTNVVDFKSALQQRASSRADAGQFNPLFIRRQAHHLADRRPPESLAETARNQGLPAQREEAWRRAEVETRYWPVKMDHDEIWIIAAKYGIVPPPGPYDVDDRMLNVRNWRQAQVA
jgi:hypothetical protein